jgi:4-hydroxy-tetrahydrodipicolinate synthase
MGSPFRIEGTYTALVTPFRDDEPRSVDWPALDVLVDAQIEGGVDGLVPCGTTGEAPTLSDAEQLDVIRHVVARARGRVRVVAGAGTNSTRETVARCKAAERAGADGVMVVVPYYSKPTQEGLYLHFSAAAQSVSCPLVVYNIPSRTGIDLHPDTLARISDREENVTAVKEATGNVLRAQELVRRFGDRLSVMCGDDTLTLPMMAVGALGVISVTSNLLPKPVSRIVKLAAEGLVVEARHTHLALLPVHEAMFLEANPGPVKAALAMAGTMKSTVRGPLAPVTEATRLAIKAALEEYERRGGRT